MSPTSRPKAPVTRPGRTTMSITRRHLLATAGAVTASAFLSRPAAAQSFPWTPSQRYPDPAVQILDPSFAKYRLPLAGVERLPATQARGEGRGPGGGRRATGMRWSEGPVWFGDARCVLWSDIPNNRIMRWDEETGAISIFRKPSN